MFRALIPQRAIWQLRRALLFFIRTQYGFLLYYTVKH